MICFFNLFGTVTGLEDNVKQRKPREYPSVKVDMGLKEERADRLAMTS